ncbi:uncharacterized protein K02A2.6-like [Anneissia japonica]|uniref:uncharacterized protein K02A2.6-like n=1 Tax=Anneissia japonica TaxID=1529436 RepID=UPI0014256806|nr:uncharacterized protein K02A2.6-like [Anneissia japonica]
MAHESLLGGHQGRRKTADRILTSFFWPGIHGDIRRFCQSCDVCQRTTHKGRVTKVPLGKMPVIEVPFERIAVDIVGPIQPITERKNRYILTIIDYATRYPEAIPLPNIEAERVAEALMQVFSRVGIPKSIFTDQGSQFTSDLMKQVSRLLSMEQLTTTPYHPAANGLVERFNGTLKLMLKRICSEKLRDWDRYIELLLFAVRETPQESLGFSPFELLYGRHVRGPMAILKELWTGGVQTGETKTTYQYVLDLRNRLEETCQAAREALKVSAKRYKTYYDRKSRSRKLCVGDNVLLLLPTDHNKLLLQRKGPFKVTKVVNEFDYEIDLNGKCKIFHINLLKQYFSKCSNSEPSGQKSYDKLDVGCTAVVEDDDGESSDGTEMLSNSTLLQPYPLQAKESIEDVVINESLTTLKKLDVMQVLKGFKDILTDLPGQTTLGQHDIKLKSSELPKGRPYPIPHTLRETVNDEVKTMLSLDVIEPSISPFASPIVLVKKPDGSNRFCVDFRRLNENTVFDAEPIPDMDELFAKIRKGKYFTKIDLSKGYWQVPMVDEAKPLTAFITPNGIFQFKVMPFGLINAPDSFSRIMRSLLRGMDGVVNYIDDILIYSTTWEEHVRSIEELFCRLRGAGLTARPSKCFVGQHQVAFLGYVVENGMLLPRAKKIESILCISPPTTKKQLRSFLGVTNYYRKFVPNYATIATPLTDLTRNKEPEKLRWEQQHENAFRLLKERLTNYPILHLPTKVLVF